MVVMRTTVALGLALALAAAADAADGDGPSRKPRITSFTLSPAESLPPRPRSQVETAPLDTPPPPPSMLVAAVPLAPEQMLGRWTERDARFCRDEQYVV
ncbi:MAG: hypothetical protein HY060_11930, partial [Proteobacteria bacterium]|nr:hypothetical protein [Pseudomonadota bacterium]